MDRYIGMDVHSSSCTIAVVGPSGRKLNCAVIETNGAALAKHLKAIPGRRKSLCMKEGPQMRGSMRFSAPT